MLVSRPGDVPGGDMNDEAPGVPTSGGERAAPVGPSAVPATSPWPRVVLALGVVLIVGAATVVGIALTSRPSDPTPAGFATPTPTPTSAFQSPAAAPASALDLSPEELAQSFGDAVWRVKSEGCGYLGTGTAFAVGPRTLITNAHVVDIDSTPTIVSRDGRTSLRTTVLGAAEDVDIAVLVVEEELTGGSLSWVDADELNAGQALVALGYPVPDHSFTVSPSTVISFQAVGPTREALRLDGLVDRGNSGGPVLTSFGRVAGVTTALLNPDATGGLQWIAVAYTYDYVADAISRIERERPGLQVTCDDPPPVPVVPDGWEWDDVPDGEVSGPNRYGDDPELDQLYDACGGGDLAACDDLYWQSAYGSEYESFAASCGGAMAEPAWGYCSWVFDDPGFDESASPQTFGDDLRLDELWTSCAEGDMADCDDLYAESPIGSEYEQFGATCGGIAEGYGLCEWEDDTAIWPEPPTQYGDDPYLDSLWDACATGDLDSCDTL